MSLTARNIMTLNPISVTPETTIVEASKIMLDRRFNGLPVVDAEKVVKGIICQSDLVMQHKRFEVPSFFFLLDGYIPLQWPGKFEEQVQRMSAAKVGDAMTPNPRTINPDTAVDDIASLMVDEKYHTLPVVEDGKLVGIVGKEDILRVMTSK